MSGALNAGVAAAAITAHLIAAGAAIGPRYEPPQREFAAHRYWRILFESNLGGGFTLVSEVEMRSTVGGADECSGGTASASASQGGAEVPASAFDNNTGTSWAMAGGIGWLKYDFGAGNEKDIREVTIRNPHSGTINNSPGGFDIEYSDDNVNWTVGSRIHMSVAEWGGAINVTRRFLIPAVSYRVNVRSTDGGGLAAFSTFQIRSTIGGADQTSGQPQAPIGFSSGSSNPSLNAFDGSDATIYASILQLLYLRFDFPTAVPLAEVMLSILNENTTRPSVFTIEASVDGGRNYIVVMAPPAQTSWLAAQDRVFSVVDHAPASDPTGVHRYWRVLSIVSATAASGVAAAEFQMREIPGGPDVGGTYSAESGTVANARDGNDATFWRTSTGVAFAKFWIKCDLGAGNEKDINEIFWRAWNNASGFNETPHIAVVQWSDDNATWHDKWYMEFSRPNAGDLDETHTYPSPFFLLPSEPGYEEPPPVVDPVEPGESGVLTGGGGTPLGGTAGSGEAGSGTGATVLLWTPAIVYSGSKSSNQLFAGRTFFSRVSKAYLLASGNYCRVAFAAGASPVTSHKAFIGIRDEVAGSGYDFDAAPRQLFFAGEPSLEIPANGILFSDPCFFEIDQSADLVVRCHASGRPRIHGPQKGTFGRHKQGDFAGDLTVTGLSDSDWRSAFSVYAGIQVLSA